MAGIIPACAGNTRSRSCLCPFARDHPRVCGEHLAHFDDEMGIEGSSPRVRGTPALTEQLSNAFGIIPACAGNTAQAAAR